MPARSSKAPIKSTQVSDPIISRALSEIRDEIPDLSVFYGARVVSGVPLVGGATNRIIHGLGRKPRGWMLVGNPEATLVVWDEQHLHGDTDRFLYLVASGLDATVNVLVF